jgi:DNA-binding transcriptional regulator YiaG
MTPAELKAWREKHKLLQAELAEMLGVFWLTISKWENGVQKIPPYLHLALAELSHRMKAKKARS